MNIRRSRFVMSLLAVAAVLATAGTSWAVFFKLEPTSDEYGLKYEVKTAAAANDQVDITFTLADAGRLRPIYSVTVVAFSEQTDRQGGRSYDVKAPIDLQPQDDGKYSGTVKISSEHADRSLIRILTLTVDGKRQTAGAAYYDIPLSKFVGKPKAPPSVAAPPAKKIVK